MNWGVENLTVRLARRKVLRSIDIQIVPGVVHAVVGGDGAGKSTLLRVLAGVGLDTDGIVRLPGPGRIGYVPPNGGFFADLSVDENMEFIADAYALDKWEARAAHLLSRAAIDRFGNRLAGNLSGGQKRKLAGSMALLPTPELLVLDEVTTGVDPVSRMDLWRLIAAAAADGAAVVVATSYLDEAERAGHVLLLHDGRVLAAGPPQTVIANMPGAVTTVGHRENGHTWRRGRAWRMWHPDGHNTDRITLEDVAIVAELAAEGVAP